MLRDWLAAAFLCSVLLLVLCLVSVAILWFASPAVDHALLLSTIDSALLPAVGFALLPAVGFALLGSFHHRSRSSCSSRCPRALVALHSSSHHWLFGRGSVCASVQSHFVVGYDSVARFRLPPMLSIAPFVSDGSR